MIITVAARGHRQDLRGLGLSDVTDGEIVAVLSMMGSYGRFIRESLSHLKLFLM
ncbi:hypothetical protein [Dongshaea marina]|uniref:hypothetical protein n=1 Tax=Dongshaea marina TaxID=2047966 RepID=UPI00131EDC92|nr:hypothetical protein [Dongshaea marina]